MPRVNIFGQPLATDDKTVTKLSFAHQENATFGRVKRTYLMKWIFFSYIPVTNQKFGGYSAVMVVLRLAETGQGSIPAASKLCSMLVYTQEKKEWRD